MADVAAPFTIRAGLLGWWRDSLRHRGLWRTLGGFVHGWYELLRDLTPARRRLRFGDLDYDFEQHVDTTWANLRWRTRVRELLAGRQYQPTDPGLFREVIGALGIEYSRFTFLDLGSGKGRALLLACEFPFRRIIGVELLPELHRIAQQNIRQFRDGAEQARISLYRDDARQFRFPPEPLTVFLFDPFPDYILEEVLANLHHSWQAHPRDLLIVYQNPISEHVLSNAAWLRRLRGNIQYAVYEAAPGPAAHYPVT
ncbi:MAG: class I SAM-dependent methyltransferase [Terriglobales bacterium]